MAVQTEQEKLKKNAVSRNQSKPPVAMELETRAPSPILHEPQAISQINNMHDSQGDISQTHFDQLTILNDTTIIGGFTADERNISNVL